MNAQIRLLKILLILMFSAAIMAPLTSCAPAALGAVEMGIEPTATPAVLKYTNQEYGFSLSYPETWVKREEDHKVILSKDSIRLVISFKWVNENIQPPRTGMAAGTPIYSGKVNLMGQAVPVNVVELNHFRKYVLYGDSGHSQVDDLAFFMILEDIETDYNQLNLAQSDIEEANKIVGSFKRIEASGSPPAQPLTTLSGVPSQMEAVAWLGHIASLPTGSQYEDMFSLYPEGTGEFGLTGSTDELEAEIQSLRDADGPNEFVHVWGLLSCGGVADYNDCQLVVDRLQYGANFSEQAITDWIGTITTSTLNDGPTFVFQMDNFIPIQYSIHASQSENLQAQIAYYEEAGERVEVSGKLMVGVPDLNGTRIEISSIEPMSMAGPRPDLAEAVLYENDEYGFSLRYSAQMTLEQEPNKVKVSQNGVQLIVAFRQAEQGITITETGELVGEFHPYNEVFLLGQPVQPSLHIQEGRIKAVYLGGPGVELGQGTPLRFAISLVNTERDWLSNAEVDQMFQIINTIQLDS